MMQQCAQISIALKHLNANVYTVTNYYMNTNEEEAAQEAMK